MNIINQIFTVAGPANWIVFQSENCHRPLIKKIFIISHPIFYTCEALLRFSSSSKFMVTELSKNIIKHYIASFQPFFPVLRFLNINQEIVEAARRDWKIKGSVILVSAALVALAFTIIATIFLSNFILTGGVTLSLLNLLPVLSIMFMSGTAGGILSTDTVIFFTKIFPRCHRIFQYEHVYANLKRAFLYLLYAPLSPFLSHEYQAQKGFILPKPDNFDNLKKILCMSEKSLATAKFFLSTEILTAQPLDKIKVDFFIYHSLFRKLLPVEDYTKFMALNAAKIKETLNENLLYLMDLNAHLMCKEMIPFNLFDKSIFLKNKQIGLQDIDSILVTLEEAQIQFQLSDDELKNFYATNIHELTSFLANRLDEDYQIFSSESLNSMQLEIFKSYVGIANLSIEPQTVSARFIKENALIENDIKNWTRCSSHKSAIKNIKKLFKERSPFLNSKSMTLLEELAGVRGYAVRQAINQLIEELPNLKKEFELLWEQLSKKSNFSAFSSPFCLNINYRESQYWL